MRRWQVLHTQRRKASAAKKQFAWRRRAVPRIAWRPRLAGSNLRLCVRSYRRLKFSSSLWKQTRVGARRSRHVRFVATLFRRPDDAGDPVNGIVVKDAAENRLGQC